MKEISDYTPRMKTLEAAFILVYETLAPCRFGSCHVAYRCIQEAVQGLAAAQIDYAKAPDEGLAERMRASSARIAEEVESLLGQSGATHQTSVEARTLCRKIDDCVEQLILRTENR